MERRERCEAGRALVLIALASVSGFLPGSHAVTCYWCGPAAEQVHRSPRPPPCAEPLDRERALECDAAHPYCATVATTIRGATGAQDPEYIESRICSKYSKESCYHRFCNSSKTWKMTCTCSGDLCNGDKDQRVRQAFARLAGLRGTSATTAISVTPARTTFPASTYPQHELFNAHEVNTLWPLSSESDTAESLPMAAALQSGAGGEDDEDSSEGSGAALRSVSPRPPNTERTTGFDRKSTPPTYQVQQNTATVLKSSAILIAAILLLE